MLLFIGLIEYFIVINYNVIKLDEKYKCVGMEDGQ